MTTVFANKSYSLGQEAAITRIQCRFRHNRYLKRSKNRGASYLEPLYFSALARKDFSKYIPIINQWSKDDRCDVNTRNTYEKLAQGLGFPARAFRAVAIFSWTKKLQGLAIFSLSGRKNPAGLNSIAIAPWNLGDKGRFRGAGTALIERIVHSASAVNTDCLILVLPISTRISFYESRKFTSGCLFEKKNRAAFLNQFAGRALPLL
jgi:hypothetical protein